MSPAPAPRPSRRRPLLVAIAAISVLILGVLVIGRVDRADVAVQVEGSVAVDPTTAPSTSAPASSTSTAVPDTIDDPAPVAVDPAPDAARMVEGLQQFVVTAERDAIDRLAATTPDLRVVESYDELGMVSVLASPEAVAALDADAEVARVEPDVPVSISFTRTPTASWGLDRIDQASLPLDSSYTAEPGATVVTTYVIDTGVLVGHTQFGDRLLPGYDVIGGVGTGSDCHGHGTHVAGTVAGSTYGVLPTALVVPIRVLDCNGSGWSSQIVSGINWVIADHVSGPAVINMSLGGGSSYSIDDAVARAVADGITVVVAAGNSNADACSYSPARAPSAITVGSTGRTDTRSYFSNWGSCVDVFAPGESIKSAYYTSTTATTTMSGTSMASPHVAGLAALLLSQQPLAQVHGPVEAPVAAVTVGSVAPSAGATGSEVTITGAGFSGVTDVRFAGTPASFTVPSASSIVATVPDGAISGAITVVASGGTATSPSDFTIIPSYNALSPSRLLDSRSSGGAIGAGSSRSLVVTGRGGVPSSGVGAVVLNVTVVDPTGSGFMTVYPSGSARPEASNLNFVVGQTVPNLVIAKVGAGGAVTLFNSNGSSHVVVDVMGWIPAG